MARRHRRVIPFDKTRRQTHWRLGDPPGGAKRKPPRDPVKTLKWALLASLILFLATPAIGDFSTSIIHKGSAGTCRIVSVVDGDTVTIYCPSRGMERARIMGYDSPELFSPGCVSEWRGALAAKWALRWNIWTASEVTLVSEGLDRYDRRLIRVFLDQRSVAQTMIEGGHGRAYGGGARKTWCV